jgi:hypothetical protein
MAAPDALDVVEVVTFTPQPGRLAPLSVAEAGDHGAPARPGGQRQRTRRPPDEVAGMGGHDQ